MTVSPLSTDDAGEARARDAAGVRGRRPVHRT
jgi:hypothetical protein